MSEYPPFFLDVRHDLAVALIPRCGSQTIRGWLGRDAIAVKRDDTRLRSVSKRVAFIRNPLDRLASAYSLFYWTKDYGGKSYRHIPTESWEIFVDYILNPKIKDEHWQPQVNLIGSVPNIFHRFENIIEHFEKYRPGILPHNNKTSRMPISDYRIAEVNKKYGDDFKLWEQIN